jgi:hypothetical protein
MDERPVEAAVDFRAKPRDMHVDHVGLGVEMIIPDMFEEHGARHDLAGMPHQVLEQAKLAWL